MEAKREKICKKYRNTMPVITREMIMENKLSGISSDEYLEIYLEKGLNSRLGSSIYVFSKKDRFTNLGLKDNGIYDRPLDDFFVEIEPFITVNFKKFVETSNVVVPETYKNFFKKITDRYCLEISQLASRNRTVLVFRYSLDRCLIIDFITKVEGSTVQVISDEMLKDNIMVAGIYRKARQVRSLEKYAGLDSTQFVGSDKRLDEYMTFLDDLKRPADTKMTGLAMVEQLKADKQLALKTSMRTLKRTFGRYGRKWKAQKEEEKKQRSESLEKKYKIIASDVLYRFFVLKKFSQRVRNYFVQRVKDLRKIEQDRINKVLMMKAMSHMFLKLQVNKIVKLYKSFKRRSYLKKLSSIIVNKSESRRSRSSSTSSSVYYDNSHVAESKKSGVVTNNKSGSWFGFVRNNQLTLLFSSLKIPQYVMNTNESDLTNSVLAMQIKDAVRKLSVILKTKHFVKFCNLYSEKYSSHKRFNKDLKSGMADWINKFCCFEILTEESLVSNAMAFQNICNNKLGYYVLHNSEKIVSSCVIG